LPPTAELTLAMDNCLLCLKSGARFFEASQKYLKCLECDLIFLMPEYRLSLQAERERYLTHNSDVEAKGYQDFVSPLCRLIKENTLQTDLGLDYGCGQGPVTSYLLTKEGYNISCYDPFFRNEPLLLARKYDFVFLCEVAEHFYNPRLEFEKLAGLLMNKKTLFVKTELHDQTKSFEKWYYKNDPTHVCFYSVQTMQWIQHHFGFQKVEFFPQYVTVFSSFS
jgi:hypothetical protein